MLSSKTLLLNRLQIVLLASSCCVLDCTRPDVLLYYAPSLRVPNQYTGCKCNALYLTRLPARMPPRLAAMQHC